MAITKITKHLKLPFNFDEDKLLNDLNILLNSKWKAHFNHKDYEGKWNSLALYAPHGDENNIFALSVSDIRTIKETALIHNCEYFKYVLSNFQCPLLSVRLLNLGAGAEIKPHKDYNLGYENDCFRLHIPITTNPKVDFILAGKRLQMNPGECWYTNVNFTHSVSNKGNKDRVHLVIDGQRNAWSDELFFSLVPKESLIYQVNQSFDDETLKRVIEELNSIQPPDSEALIQKLKRDHIEQSSSKNDSDLNIL